MSQTPKSPPNAHADAGWTLVRWIGIPLVLVAALYFIERTYERRPTIVVTSHGPGMTPEEMAAAHPVPSQPAQAPAVGPAPLVPVQPQPNEPPAAPTQPLRALSQPNPVYPPRALDAEKEGVVHLRLTIGADGVVDDAVVTGAEPRGWFEGAARDAVKRWRYAPSERGGTTDVDVEFKLK